MKSLSSFADKTESSGHSWNLWLRVWADRTLDTWRKPDPVSFIFSKTAVLLKQPAGIHIQRTKSCDNNVFKVLTVQRNPYPACANDWPVQILTPFYIDYAVFEWISLGEGPLSVNFQMCYCSWGWNFRYFNYAVIHLIYLTSALLIWKSS